MSSPGPSPDPSDPPDSPDRPDPLPDPGSGPPSPLRWLVRSDLGSGVTLAIGTLLIHRCATLFNLGDYVWVAVFAFIAAVLALHLWQDRTMSRWWQVGTATASCLAFCAAGTVLVLSIVSVGAATGTHPLDPAAVAAARCAAIGNNDPGWNQQASSPFPGDTNRVELRYSVEARCVSGSLVDTNDGHGGDVWLQISHDDGETIRPGHDSRFATFEGIGLRLFSRPAHLDSATVIRACGSIFGEGPPSTCTAWFGDPAGCHPKTIKPVHSPENIIADAGFEQQSCLELSSPWSRDGSDRQSVSLGCCAHGGANSARIGSDGSGEAPTSWNGLSQQVTVSPKTVYHLSAYVRAAGNIGTVYLGGRLPKGPFAPANGGVQSIAAGDGYTKIATDFKTDGSTAITIYVGYLGTGTESTLYVDDVSLGLEPKTTGTGHHGSADPWVIGVIVACRVLCLPF